MKPKKPSGAVKYEFHRPGRKPAKGRINETGGDLGGRTVGWSERVVVEVKGKGRHRNAPLAEKRFPDHYYTFKSKNVFVLDALRKLGLSVIPTARLALRKDITRPGMLERPSKQIMTDLTRGGEFKVIDYKYAGGKVTSEVTGLRNFKEIQEQIQREQKIATSHGFRFDGSEWLIVIDPKTNMGKPYIVDVKATELKEEPARKLSAWRDKLGF